MSDATSAMTDGELDADVVIVGAGPTGLLIANLLGLEGVSVVVLESRDTLIDYPRGVGLDDESLRIIQATGLVEHVLVHVVPNQQLSYLTAKGRPLATFAPTTLEFGWPRKNGFVQPLVDRVLCDGLDRFDRVEVRFGCELTDIDEGDDAVTAVVRTPNGEKRVTGRYLVGCDGGRSATRTWMGVAFDGVSVSTRWLVLDLANDPIGTPNAFIYADPKRPYVTLGLPHGIRRFEFKLHDDESTEDAEEGDLAFRLIAPHVTRPHDVDIIRRRVYTHHARVASSFRHGRVLIGGDAAHLMPVWQGLGYNTGVRDAGNLAWKLAWVVQGHARPALLDSYDAERRPHARSMVGVSHAAGRFLGVRNRAVAKVRDVVTTMAGTLPPVRDYFVQQRYKPLPSYDDGAVVPNAGVACIGRLFPQPDVIHRGATVKFDDVVGNRVAVVRWSWSPTAALSEQTRKVLAGVDAVFVRVVPANQHPEPDDGELVVQDGTGALRRWFDQHPPFVVLRPDRIVAAACQAQAATATVAALAQVLHLTDDAAAVT